MNHFKNKHITILKTSYIYFVSFSNPSTISYRQLLSNELNGGLKSPCATCGFILHGFDRFQQRGHIGHHHLKHIKREERTVYQQCFELFMKLI